MIFGDPNIRFDYVHIKKKLKVKMSVETNHKIIFLIKNTILNNHMSFNFLYFIDSLDNTSNILADKNEPAMNRVMNISLPNYQLFLQRIRRMQSYLQFFIQIIIRM